MIGHGESIDPVGKVAAQKAEVSVILHSWHKFIYFDSLICTHSLGIGKGKVHVIIIFSFVVYTNLLT